jgi:hypothetical protein
MLLSSAERLGIDGCTLFLSQEETLGKRSGSIVQYSYSPMPGVRTRRKSQALMIMIFDPIYTRTRTRNPNTTHRHASCSIPFPQPPIHALITHPPCPLSQTDTKSTISIYQNLSKPPQSATPSKTPPPEPPNRNRHPTPRPQAHEKTHSPHSIRTDLLPATRKPKRLLAHRRAGVRRIDHIPGPLEDADVHDARGAVAARGPEQQVAGQGVGAGQVVA